MPSRPGILSKSTLGRRSLTPEKIVPFWSRFRRMPTFGVTSVCLFVVTCLAVSVIVMVFTNEGHLSHYFRRAEVTPNKESSRWLSIPGEPESDDLDPDLEEDVPAAYRAFVFAPQQVESDSMDWWERQVSRKEHVKRTCERVLGNFEGNNEGGEEDNKSSNPQNPERLLKDMVLDPEDNVLFCPSMLDPMQKSTKWDSLLAHAGSEALRVHMSGTVRGISEVDTRTIRGKVVVAASAAKEQKPQDMSWLKRFTKILFVEHPFEKIIALYRNRVSKREGFVGYEMGKRALVYNRGMRNLTDKDMESGTMSFSEMTSYIIHRDFIDPHVKSIFEVCSPCEFDYDYIVKAETFSEDLKNIFKQIHPSAKWRKMLEKFPEYKEFEDDKIDKTLLKYYKDLPEDDLLMLYDLYSIDMFMFNYQWPFAKLRVSKIAE